MEYKGVWGVRMYDKKSGSCPTMDGVKWLGELGDEIVASGILAGGATQCRSCGKAFGPTTTLHVFAPMTPSWFLAMI